MHIIYPSVIASKYKGSNLGTPDPVYFYAKHYINGLVLSYIIKKGTNFTYKQRANLELEICERKQEFWKRKLNQKALEDVATICHKNFISFLVNYADFYS